MIRCAAGVAGWAGWVLGSLAAFLVAYFVVSPLCIPAAVVVMYGVPVALLAAPPYLLWRQSVIYSWRQLLEYATGFLVPCLAVGAYLALT